MEVFTILGGFGQLKTKPNKANFRRNDILSAEGLRLPQSLRSFAMTLRVCYLKKQSQFAYGQTDATFYLKGFYEEKPRF